MFAEEQEQEDLSKNNTMGNTGAANAKAAEKERPSLEEESTHLLRTQPGLTMLFETRQQLAALRAEQSALETAESNDVAEEITADVSKDEAAIAQKSTSDKKAAANLDATTANDDSNQEAQQQQSATSLTPTRGQLHKVRPLLLSTNSPTSVEKKRLYINSRDHTPNVTLCVSHT